MATGPALPGLDGAPRRLPTTRLPAGWQLGLAGRVGNEPFVIGGVCTRRNADGWQWREWHLYFDDGGRTAYLAEADGALWLLWPGGRRPDDGAALRRGQTVALGGVTYEASEVSSAQLVDAAGQLQHVDDLRPSVAYADCLGPARAVASVEFGPCARSFCGEVVDAQALGTPRAAPASRAVRCPSCDAEVVLRHGADARVVTCGGCARLLGVDGAEDRPQLLASEPLSGRGLDAVALPLQRTGRLNEVHYTVVGCLRRVPKADGLRYAWTEYALVDDAGGERWLVHNRGHWTFVQPVTAEQGRAALRLRKFLPVDSGVVYVDAAVGEFRFPLRVGQESFTHDAVAPPQMVSTEASEDEVHWSVGTYLTVGEVEKAFGLRVAASPEGTAPHQPWVYGNFFPPFLCFVLATWAVWAAGHATARTAFHQTLEVAAQADAQSGQTLFTLPFALQRWRNVVVRVSFPELPANAWADVEGDLVNESSGLVVPWDAAVGVWSGSDEGEAWSEGSRTDQRDLSAVAAGDYVLRLSVLRGPWSTPTKVELQVTQGSPDNTSFACYLAFHLAVFLLWFLARTMHESARVAHVQLLPRTRRWAVP